MAHPLAAPTFPWTEHPNITPQSAVHSSCAALEQHAKHVRLNRDALRAFTLSLPPSAWVFPSPRAFPLRFTLDSSINFHCVLSLLQFGSGYRAALHAATGRGASDTVTYGVVGMHISAAAIDAAYLSRLSVHDIAELFRLPIHEEYEIQRGITSERRTPLWPFADDLRRVCNECGAALRSLQCDSFADFVLRRYPAAAASAVAGAAKPESAASLLRRLIETFPSLRDQYVLSPDRTVFLYKRAQLLVAELAVQHAAPTTSTAPPSAPQSPLLAFDVTDLSAFADNVLPCVLNAHGVLQYDEELRGLIERGEEVTDERMQAELRGLSVLAIDEAVRLWLAERSAEVKHENGASAGESVCAASLDYFLWSVAGKEEAMRKRPRHASRHTVYY